MPLVSPNLDDLTFEQLVAQARVRISQSCPEWTDLSAHDPGMVLVEVFAYLTETLMYRVNRLPEKAYVEFLRLIGVKLRPPGAAGAELLFSSERPAASKIEIPRGTRVTAARSAGGAPPVFITSETVWMEQGTKEARVKAYHAQQVEAELLGHGTGRPGLSLALQRPPVVAPTGSKLDVVIGVEAKPEELSDRADARAYEGKQYRIWREVEGFTPPPEDPHVYVADRLSGTITFAPFAQLESDPNAHALAAVPEAGREIRAWYRRGGGPEGNVPAGALTVLKDPIPGVSLTVTNPGPAVGGRAAETLDEALARGPEEIHSLRRAVTASDFEALALRSSGAVARARAFAQATLWAHAAPGTVEVVLVPDLPPSERGAGESGVTATKLTEHQTAPVCEGIQRELDRRCPLAMRSKVTWARYKPLSVKVKLVAHEAEDLSAVRSRVLERLYRMINPLPAPPGSKTDLNPGGWPFGEPLHHDRVYGVVLSEPGVAHVEGRVKMVVERVPAAVSALASDRFQARTWYACSGDTLYRSQDDGAGWEPAGGFPGETLTVVQPHGQIAGLLAIVSQLDDVHSQIRLSFDCGETWSPQTHTLDQVVSLAWMQREGAPVLLIASGKGLFELSMLPGSTPLQVVVDTSRPGMGFWSVVAVTDARGVSSVAVVAREKSGVFLSTEAGRRGSFRRLGLEKEDARILAVQYDGPRTSLWAGTFAPSGEDAGKGCFVYDLTGAGGWRAVAQGWNGGSCRALAFQGARAFAGTHRGGVLTIDSSRDDASWSEADLRCGLPLREQDRLFEPVLALATRVDGSLLMAGGQAGVFKTEDARTYEPTSQAEYDDVVTLPPTWLFCSGQHEIEVTHDASGRD